MRQRNYLDRVTVFFAILLVCLVSSVLGPRLTYGQEVLRGLDLTEVRFALSAPPAFYGALEARAMKQFGNAGFKLRELDDRYPRLDLSLWPDEGKHCKDIEIFQPKLELLEEVALVRSGHKTIATTWFYGLVSGHETKHLSLADLQREQDEMLKVFIDQYKFLNPRK